MKAVMYHYVRRYDSSLPNFRFLDVENFSRQLRYFRERSGFVEKDEWLAFIHEGKMPMIEGKFLLTFDDAMRCHYDYVFPELIANRLWGIFYVPTAPYVGGKILDVHRIHLLCGAYEGSRLMQLALSYVDETTLPALRVEEFRSAYHGQKNDLGIAEFKRLMNYYIDGRQRARVLDAICAELGFSIDARRFYVPVDGLEEMKASGMLIGSHSHTHPVMKSLDPLQQRAEIETSFRVLSGLVDNSPRTYCHPFGGFQSFDSHTIAALHIAKVSYAFSVENRDIRSSDHVVARHFLPRYDCNQFEYGRAS